MPSGLTPKHLEAPSDWAVAEVITWKRTLSHKEMKQASTYLGHVLGNTVCCGGDSQQISENAFKITLNLLINLPSSSYFNSALCAQVPAEI